MTLAGALLLAVLAAAGAGQEIVSPGPSPEPAAAAALPDAGALVAALGERWKTRGERVNEYIYDIDELTEDLRADGTVAETETRRWEVFFVRGRRVRRLVAENGVELDAKRKAKEDKRVDERYERIIEEDDAGKGSIGELLRVLDRFQFTVVAREVVAGRPAVALDFSARAGKWDLENDAALRVLAGRMWIDEEDHELARVELRNSAPLRVGFGLVASISDLDATLQFVRLADGVWMTSRSTSMANGRIALLRKLRRRTTETYSNFRKFTVSTEEAAAPAH